MYMPPPTIELHQLMCCFCVFCFMCVRSICLNFIGTILMFLFHICLVCLSLPLALCVFVCFISNLINQSMFKPKWQLAECERLYLFINKYHWHHIWTVCLARTYWVNSKGKMKKPTNNRTFNWRTMLFICCRPHTWSTD